MKFSSAEAAGSRHMGKAHQRVHQGCWRGLSSFSPEMRLPPFTWKVSNGVQQHAEGSATLYFRIWKNTKGEFRIVQVEQRRI
jgi:hypothetical protein